MKVFMLLLFLVAMANASDVNWTRFTGKVKSIDLKSSKITIQNAEGDLITVKFDDDVMLYQGKTSKVLSDIGMDEKVTLVYMPRPPKPKEAGEEPSGGFYPPLKR